LIPHIPRTYARIHPEYMSSLTVLFSFILHSWYAYIKNRDNMPYNCEIIIVLQGMRARTFVIRQKQLIH
jgi:hypothetical protein